MIANRPTWQIEYEIVVPCGMPPSCESGLGSNPIIHGIEYIFIINNKGYHISFNAIIGDDFNHYFPEIKRMLDSVELVNSEGPINITKRSNTSL
jgi:hypothetical protein